nr:MAG TPA: hypothetical protein [Caudoviricetes sp.]
MNDKLEDILESDVPEREKILTVVNKFQVAAVHDAREISRMFRKVYDVSKEYQEATNLKPEDALADLRAHLWETIEEVDEHIDGFIKHNKLEIE